MEYRKLGNTGIKVSELCLGSMQFGWTADDALSHKILSEAVSNGINFIDTADIYSRWVPGNPGGVSEAIIGKWLIQTSVPRHQLVIATKVRGKTGTGPNDEGLSRAHIFQAVDDSLRRLQTDYIDLYQTHWVDEQTPIEETLCALDDLVRMGKIRYIGCSNYPAWRLTEALWTSRMNNFKRFDVLQPHYNIVHREEFEKELADVCRAYHLGVIPYSPLAGGFLTGKYRRENEVDSARQGGVRKYYQENYWTLLDTIDGIARAKPNASMAQVALAWLLANPLITSPIIGPRTIEQLKDNLGAVGLELDQDEMKHLEESSARSK